MTRSPISFAPRYQLVPRNVVETSPWARPELLKGEARVLSNPLIEQANQAILDQFQPQHPAVIFSLCSATRPYYRSPKWKMFLAEFGSSADLVICSNGGVIPMQYAHCWPFMEYDARRVNARHDAEYKDMVVARITTFLARFPYRTIIHVYTPSSRNRAAILANGIPGTLFPSAPVQAAIREEWFERGNMRYKLHPHTYPALIEEVREALRHPTPQRTVPEEELTHVHDQ